MADLHRRTCFCTAVEIEVRGEPEQMGYCHCSSCRTYSGAPLTAFVLWRDEKVAVVQGAELLGRFNKSVFSNRRFCTRCGGTVMTEHPGFGFTDVYPRCCRPPLQAHRSPQLLRDGIADQRWSPEIKGSSRRSWRLWRAPSGISSDTYRLTGAGTRAASLLFRTWVDGMSPANRWTKASRGRGGRPCPGSNPRQDVQSCSKQSHICAIMCSSEVCRHTKFARPPCEALA